MATPYSFTQPIRYYKANDPYYYEVDNIPLRQLEENILHIKGLLEGTDAGDTGGGGGGNSTGGYLTSNSELDINNIKQLKPKAGGGRTVTVNAGRFVSRVNDAFDINKPLSKLIVGSIPSSTQIGTVDLQQEWTQANRDAVWNAFVGTAAASKAYNVNGLETWHTFHSTPGTMGTSWTTTYGPPFQRMYPHYAGVTIENAKAWPGPSDAGSLSPTVWPSAAWIQQAQSLPQVHLSFVQMWRGVFRTSVVDFPDVSIDIPAWDDNDFYYRDANGDVVEIAANQRIDLLVAYSLPIDSSSTTLNNFETGFIGGASPTATTLTTPTLGLVRGAGVGIKRNDSSNPLSIDTTEGGDEPTGPAGSARIAANSSDSEVGANVGIRRVDGTIVHGSFPSPDDLLNLAPTIALGTDSDAWGLIGQAALPLAYIVVTKGQDTITTNDIIDIRPFLRTTEFTYNERAGIAAANPPLSFANPAVGAWQLQRAIDATLAATDDPPAPTNNGRAIYTDYVMGGLAYGVEGTLLTMCDNPQETQDPFGAETQTAAYTDPFNSSSISFGDLTSSKAFLENTDQYLRESYLQYVYNNRQTDLKRWLSDPNSSFSQNTHTYLGLPQGNTGRNIPLYPEWDMPMDGTNYLNLMGQGTQGSTAAIPKPTWWMWFESADPPNRPLSYAPGGVPSLLNTSTGGGSYLDKQYSWGYGDQTTSWHPAGSINVCTKKLEISFPSWVNDYDIMVEYVNCGPVTNTSSPSVTEDVGLGSGLSINKGPVVSFPSGAKKAVFQINSNSQPLPEMVYAGQIQDKLAGPNQSPIEAANRSYQWLSYSVVLPQFRNTTYGTGLQTTAPDSSMRFVPKLGAAYYPSIKFTIIGYTGSPVEQNAAYNQNGNNFTLIQEVIAGDSSVITGLLGPVNGTSKINIQGM